MSPLLLLFFVVATASNFTLALAYSIFLFFSETSSFFFWTFSLFLPLFSTTISSSSIHMECVDVVATYDFVVASS
jgi:hypothetical protein